MMHELFGYTLHYRVWLVDILVYINAHERIVYCVPCLQPLFVLCNTDSLAISMFQGTKHTL